MDSLSQIDPDHHFPQLEIECVDQQLKLKNVSLGESMLRLQDMLQRMQKSQFYKNINVLIGAKSKHSIGYVKESYERKIEVLKMQLEEEKNHLKDIVGAKDEDELAIRQLQHRRNQLYIEDKKKQIHHPDFIPCLYVQAEKKIPFYGQITQEFSRHGMGNFVAKLGYRAPFFNYDSLELDLEWPINSSLRSYYRAFLDWSNPISVGSFHLRAGSSNQPTFRSIDSQIGSVSWGIQGNGQRLDLEIASRKPFVHDDVHKNMSNGFYLPSRKVALKYYRSLMDTISFGDISEGVSSDIRAELALPFLGNSSFCKIDFNYRQFFDTFRARNWFDHPWLRKMLWKSTVQVNFSATILAEWKRQCYLNDVLDSMDVRGFDPLRQPFPSYANVKSTAKFNIHNYPLLQQARIVSFLYAQAGLSFLKAHHPTRPLALSSTGLGLSLYAGPSAQIEILCNLAQWQSRPSREPVGFQVRFGIYD